MTEMDKRVNELTTRIEMLELENQGLRSEIRQLSETDDEQRRQIGVLTDEILYLHNKNRILMTDIFNERLDRIIERQKGEKYGSQR